MIAAWANNIQQNLKALADVTIAENSQRFFKEPLTCYGIKSHDVRRVAKQAINDTKTASKEEIIQLCEILWRSGYFEASSVACDLIYSRIKNLLPNDFSILENWVNCYVNNWASCDTLCNHTIGEFIERYPEYIPQVQQWAQSNNRWLRRGAAVTFIIPAKKGLFLDKILQIATVLLTDQDDLVQKGYGWMLKSASEAHPEAIFYYLMQNRDTMPRTAFRYALEKLPLAMRQAAMQK